MKRSKTDYRGGDALTLATRALELVVTTSVGPRVVSFRSTVGKKQNGFLELPADEKRGHGYLFRGGHRLWHSPEDIVRTYQPDDLPLDVKMLPRGVALKQPVEERTGMEKGMKIELTGERTVKVTHALTNRGMWDVECAAWALTIFRPGGYAVLPLLPKGSHARGDLLPTYALVPWSYTDFSFPVWDFHREFIGIDVARATEPQKLGITDYPGWSAYWIDGTTFVKFARVVRGATYSDRGSAFETFTNGAMIELETLAPFGKIAPNATATHVEYWTVFDGLARPNTDAAFAKLAAGVKNWISKL